MANADSTPIASTRIRPTRPARPSLRSISHRGNSKMVRWNLSPSSDSSPTPSSEPGRLSRSDIPRAAASCSTDVLGRLSLAQNTIRQLRRDLETCEAELNELRVEKERYEESHGKLYSQMSSLRNKCQAYEQQLAKRTSEWDETKERNRELEEECDRLKAMFVDEAAKQGQRVRTLEAQLAAVKLDCETAFKTSKLPDNGAIKEERIKWLKHMESLKSAHETEITTLNSSIAELRKRDGILLGRLEESRTLMTRLSTEKACLLNDIRRLQEEKKKVAKKEDKDLDLEQELHLRLAELETERSNAKTALKKAMAILDHEEELQHELDIKDARIRELEGLLLVKSVALPPINHVTTAAERMNLQNKASVPLTSSMNPQERLLNAASPAVLAAKQSALSTPVSGPEPVFAIPMAPIKNKTEDSTADQFKSKLSAIHDTNTRLRKMATGQQ